MTITFNPTENLTKSSFFFNKSKKKKTILLPTTKPLVCKFYIHALEFLPASSASLTTVLVVFLLL